MCGISCVISKDGSALYSLAKMTDTINHRGPDDEGFVLFGTNGADPVCFGGNDTPAESFSCSLLYSPTRTTSSAMSTNFMVGLGHRRLSILDLSSLGHQPMCSSDGTLWITFNGEIYNYLELADELKIQGHKFLSSSDTEVILTAYKQWGPECLMKFIGMWSFVIYDSEKREVFAARDRYGIKPLYYWFSSSGDLCFGSEIKQFSVFEGWRAKLNSQRAYDYLVYSLTDHTDETMFQGVYHIPGGHYFKSSLTDLFSSRTTKLQLSLWYNVDYAKYAGPLAQAGKLFEMHFRNSVRMHLRSDVAIGSALSGGLDSSAIVCEVNNQLKSEGKGHTQKTFSSCSVDKRYDERNWMEIVIDQTEVDAHFIYPKFDDLFQLTPKILWHQDEPYQSQSVYLGYHVFELAKANKVKVVLNGQGADEYLGGYEQFRAARQLSLVKNLRLALLFKEVMRNKRYKLAGKLKITAQILNNLMPEFFRKEVQKKFGQCRKIKKLIDLKKLGAKEEDPNNHIPVKYNTIPQISKHQTFYSMLPKLLRWEDRNSMAHSIESRVPFLDHRLVEFSFNLPDKYLDDHDKTKNVMRVGLTHLLPPKILDRKDKKGFITPEERWVKEDHTEVFRTKLEEAIVQLKGIIKPEALVYFEKIVSGKLPFDYTYWRLILFAGWVKQFNVEISQPGK
jgi:asparagine synthase (glutamine-hydrolysing)